MSLASHVHGYACGAASGYEPGRRMSTDSSRRSSDSNYCGSALGGGEYAPQCAPIDEYDMRRCARGLLSGQESVIG